VTTAVFQATGKTPVVRELLNIMAKGKIIPGRAIWRSRAEIASIPVALSCRRLLMNITISRVVIWGRIGAGGQLEQIGR
jgi:hypothetical protein